MKLKLVFKETGLKDKKYLASLRRDDYDDFNSAEATSLYRVPNHLFALSGKGETKEEALNELKANINFIFEYHI